MKNPNRIPQLTLELYNRGLATSKERKQVENALRTDIEVQKRYIILQEQYTLPAPPRGNTAGVFLFLAAVFVCALVPAILYLKNSGSNRNIPTAAPPLAMYTEAIPPPPMPQEVIPPDISIIFEDMFVNRNLAFYMHLPVRAGYFTGLPVLRVGNQLRFIRGRSFV
jgi:hypothetical protein